MTDTIQVCAANQLRGEIPVDPIVLEISQPLPPAEQFETMQEAEAFFLQQAELVLQALHRLPQGTLHQILVIMLRNKADYLSGTGIYGKAAS